MSAAMTFSWKTRVINDGLISMPSDFDLSDVSDKFARIAKAVDEFMEPLRRTFKEAQPHLEVIQRQAEAVKVLEASGWLPHDTTPFSVLDDGKADPIEVDRMITDFYATNWEGIECAIEEKLEMYEIDSEAKDAFREALTAHRHGLYRSVCRLLFPELERLSWLELHGGVTPTKVTSQHKLIERVGRFTLPELEIGMGGLFTFSLFKTLKKHLYAKAEGIARLQELEVTDVPNRHACVHGLVVYKTAKNSLNTIFMADFLFWVIHAIKQHDTEAAEE